MKPWTLLSAVPGFGGLVQRDITCNSVIQSCWQRKLFIKRDLVCECVQLILPVIVIRATLSANLPITRCIVSSQKENAVGMQKQSEAYPLISALRSMMVFVWATTWIIGHWQTVVRWLWGSWMYMSGRERRDDNWDMMDGSVSSGPAQHLRWAEFQGRVGVAEDQKFKVLTMTSEGNKRHQYWKPFTAVIYQSLMTDLFFGQSICKPIWATIFHNHTEVKNGFKRPYLIVSNKKGGIVDMADYTMSLRLWSMNAEFC